MKNNKLRKKKEVTNRELLKFIVDNVVTKEDIKDFIKKDDIKDFIRKTDISNFVTRDDIKIFVTKKDIKELNDNILNIAEAFKFYFEEYPTTRHQIARLDFRTRKLLVGFIEQVDHEFEKQYRGDQRYKKFLARLKAVTER